MLSRDNKIFSLENQSFSSRRVIFILWKRFVIRRSLSFIISLIGLRHFLEYAAWSGWYLPKMKGTTAFVSLAAMLTFEITSLLRNGISHAATKLYSDEAWKRPVYIPPRLPAFLNMSRTVFTFNSPYSARSFATSIISSLQAAYKPGYSFCKQLFYEWFKVYPFPIYCQFCLIVAAGGCSFSQESVFY